MGGGWMIIGVIVCIAIIVGVVWLVMRLLNHRQTPPNSTIPQPQPYQMNGQGYQYPPQQSTGTYQEGEKQYSYPQQERPLE